MPTFNHFRGDAQGVAQVDTFTASGAAVGDTFTLTINRKTVSYTLTQAHADASAEPSNSAEVHVQLLALLVASLIPEFVEVTWTVERDDVDEDDYSEALNITGTGPSDGTPFTCTASTTDAGSTILVETLTEGSPGTNEIQQVSLGSASSGTWTLTFQGQTTAALAYNISAAALTTAVNLLSNVASGDLVITGDDGGPFTIEFKQAYANTNVSLITGNGASLDGGTAVSVATVTEGGGGTTELQTVDFGTVTNVTYVLTITDPDTAETFAFGELTASSAATWQDRANAELILAGSSGRVVVTDLGASVYQYEFTGSWVGKDMALMTADDVLITVTETRAGAAGGTGEVQKITLTGGPTGGTFTLTFDGQTTSAIAYNASALTIESDLEGLSTITGVTVTGDSGGPWTVTFVDPTGDVSLISGNAASLTGGAVTVATTQAATVRRNEVQRVTIVGTPTGGTFTLTANPIGGGDETTSGIAYNAAASAVDSALEALTSWTSGDATVTGSAGGPYTITFTGTWAGTNVALLTGSGASLTGGGTETFTRAASITPSGPNYWDAATNWSAGTAPATDEIAVVENSDVPIKYGLDNPTISPEAIQVKASYTGSIGLPDWNPLGYYEYRPTALRIGVDGTGSNTWMDVEIGEGEGVGCSLFRIDTGDKETRFRVEHTGDSSDNVSPVVQIVNDSSSTAAASILDLYRGSVGVGYIEDEAASFATIQQAHRGNIESDTSLHIGDRCVLGTLVKTGGTALVSTGLPSTTVTSITNEAGDLEIIGEGDLSALIIKGGDVVSKTTGVIGGYGAITGITAADPAVVTSTAHGLADGDIVRISGVVGMTEINQLESAVEVVNANSFQLIGIAAGAFTAYSSGGEWSKVGSVEVSGECTLDFTQSLSSVVVAPAIDLYGNDAVVTFKRGKLSTKSYLTGEFALRFLRGEQDGTTVYRS